MSIIKGYLGTKDTPAGALTKVLKAVTRRAARPTDICDHLATLFMECLGIEARLIVELGSGDGESTFVLERVAKLWDGALVSVDIEDREEVGTYPKRHFVKSDDISFAALFPAWCAARGLAPAIDILFIDTSHRYEHTGEEIRHWFPYLSPRCKVVFHDTNLQEVFVRRDGSRGRGWNNDRGVIRAIEDHFGRRFDESRDFFREDKGWLIRHWTHCNGLLIMDRYEGGAAGDAF